MGGCSLRIWLQKDAYIVLGSLHLSTDALRNRKPELCPGLTVCICRQEQKQQQRPRPVPRSRCHDQAASKQPVPLCPSPAVPAPRLSPRPPGRAPRLPRVPLPPSPSCCMHAT
ncbi:hypothetical protein Taro_017431 [Colocasia esculenta]|uniref:Uncharacterized protein n=1 Tax=Colocasia esculenta TaxID=4460 RepID=A0A843UZD3_COLES|nr:hypothetical protein [Colocasia esculenta]